MREHQRVTRAAYDVDAAAWKRQRNAQQLGRARDLRSRTEGLILDVGCGPGWHLPELKPAIGLDLSIEMLKQGDADLSLTQGDMTSLPFARESLGGLWASRSLVHLPRTEVPIALAELHRVMKTGASGCLWMFEGDAERTFYDGDPLPGRTFSYWPVDLLERTLQGAGFAIEELDRWQSDKAKGQIAATVTRQWSLPDYVGPDMKLLICGLNPSPGSADSGVGFHRAGNRFWPAAIKAGLVSRDRDPVHALRHHGMGMTDMVKRPTRRADELDKTEYRQGLERVRELVEWLQPQAICMVGLAGWRAAVDRKAERGWQQDSLGGRPVYLMPSTSGLNAHDTIDTLTDHLKAAAAGR